MSRPYCPYCFKTLNGVPLSLHVLTCKAICDDLEAVGKRLDEEPVPKNDRLFWNPETNKVEKI